MTNKFIPRFFIVILLVNVFCLFSCDILRFEIFEVTAWSPGEGYHSAPEEIVISLDFSLAPDRGSIEKNFSLTGNGTKVKGEFSWTDKKMTFIPLSSLEKNTDYTINLSADARNGNGLSLDKVFNCEFTTRQESERLVLISCYPELYAVIDDLRTQVRLEFSNSVPLNNLYDFVLFTPSVSGSWHEENNGMLFIFTPSEPWQQKTRYEISFSTSLTDINGINIGNDFLSVFSTNSDREAPYLQFAQKITKYGEKIDLYPDNIFYGITEYITENSNWDKEDKLFLVFSEPVDIVSVKNYLSVTSETGETIPSLIMETAATETKAETNTGFSSEFIFKFDGYPPYQSRFTIRLKPGVKDTSGNTSNNEPVYRIFADSYLSRPPVLIGFRMPMAPSDKTDLQFFYSDTETIFKDFPITDAHYPSGTTVETWIELYFDAAGEIDLFSVMDLFRIDTTNLVISFSPRKIINKDFTILKPHEEWEKYQRIEISGNLTNSNNFGIIYIQIDAGLLDSLGNKNENPQVISIIK